MVSVDVKQYNHYEQLHFPGPSIDYEICWQSSNLENTKATHGRIEIHTMSADAGSSGPTLEEVSSWAAQVGYTKLPRIPCIAKVTWSLCEASFSCAYNPATGLLGSFLLERMNGYMKTPQGTPWLVTLSHAEIDGDKTALMLVLVQEPLTTGHDILYLLAKRIVQGTYQSPGKKRQVPLMIGISAHEEEVANRTGSSKSQVLFNRAEPVSKESIREEGDKGNRAPKHKRSSMEEQEGASTSQLPPSSPKLGAPSRKKDVESMQAMIGKRAGDGSIGGQLDHLTFDLSRHMGISVRELRG